MTLRACDAQADDGTRLLRCVKTYLPAPAGQWGMVFEIRHDPDVRLFLDYLAFGIRHPSRLGQPSVHQLAHRRLHPDS